LLPRFHMPPLLFILIHLLPVLLPNTQTTSPSAYKLVFALTLLCLPSYLFFILKKKHTDTFQSINQTEPPRPDPSFFPL
jgi:hypothetical protein